MEELWRWEAGRGELEIAKPPEPEKVERGLQLRLRLRRAGFTLRRESEIGAAAYFEYSR